MENMKNKISAIVKENEDLRGKVEKQSVEIKALNENIRKSINESLEKAVESIVHLTTKALTAEFVNRQDNAEKENIEKFKSLEENIAVIKSLLQSSPQPNSEFLNPVQSPSVPGPAFSQRKKAKPRPP